jgi:mRNA interferase MazF
MKRYVPERGDAAWLNLNTPAGHEQTGRRPVLILSSRGYNERTGLAIVCPMTSNIKGYPFEVPSELTGRRGAILADHVRSVDWVARDAKHIGKLSAAIVERVASIVSKLVGA